jgi:hypothetical protein
MFSFTLENMKRKLFPETKQTLIFLYLVFKVFKPNAYVGSLSFAFISNRSFKKVIINYNIKMNFVKNTGIKFKTKNLKGQITVLFLKINVLKSLSH